MCERIKKLVLDTYYDLSNAAAYAGPAKVYKVLQQKDIKDIGLFKVRKILQNEDKYSLQKPIRRSFKILQVRVTEIDEQFEADLCDFTSNSKFNSGYKFALVILDVFSRFLFARPLNTKQTDEVVKALKDIFKHTERRPRKLYTDKCDEFVSGK